MLEYVDTIHELKSNISNLNKLYEESNIIIDNLGRDAKLLYLSLKSVQRSIVEQEIKLPEYAKRKIGETIMQSLQKAERNEKEVGSKES